MLATGKYYDLALITTDLTTPVEQIISRYAARWTIEVVFAQMRQNLGVGQARNRTARAVERTVPFGLTTYTHEPRQQDHATGESRARSADATRHR